MKTRFAQKVLIFVSLFLIVSLVGCKTNFKKPAYQNTPQALAQTITPGSGDHIALLLPAKGPHAAAAKTIRDGFLATYYQNAQHEPSEAAVKIYDTTENGVQAAYQRALQEQARLIVGPLTKSEVQTIANMPLEIPVLALNTISEDTSLPQNLYQFGLLPEDEVIAVAEHARRAGHQRALILAPHSEWGQRLARTFKRYWESNQGRVVDARFF